MSNEIAANNNPNNVVVGDRSELIERAFQPIVEIIPTLVSKAIDIMKEEPSEGNVEEAKVIRKKLSKVRTTIDKVHKKEKSYALEECRMYDAKKKELYSMFKDHEDVLRTREGYFEELKRLELEERCDRRIELIQEIDPDVHIKRPEIQAMDDDVFETYIDGIAAAKAKRDEDAKLLEEARKIKAEQEAKEREIEKQRIAETTRIMQQIKEENEKLREKKELLEAQLEVEQAEKNANHDLHGVDNDIEDIEGSESVAVAEDAVNQYEQGTIEYDINTLDIIKQDLNIVCQLTNDFFTDYGKSRGNKIYAALGKLINYIDKCAEEIKGE